jgi:hypothetical protein
MKKYDISAAQLIELIKNSQSKSSGNKINSSSIDSTTADSLIERKKFNNLTSSTNTSSKLNHTLASSPSSSSTTKIYSHEIKRPTEKRKDHFN